MTVIRREKHYIQDIFLQCCLPDTCLQLILLILYTSSKIYYLTHVDSMYIHYSIFTHY